MAGGPLKILRAEEAALPEQPRGSEQPWLAAATCAGLLIGQQIAAKSLRDALFLSTYTARELPKIMAVATFISLIVAVSTGQLMRNWGPRRLVALMLAGNGTAFLAEWLLFADFPKEVTVTLYLHVASLGALLVSGFWSVMSEQYDPYSAKRLLGRIGGGATLGGVLGAACADIVTRSAGVAALFPILALTSAAGALAVHRLPSGATPATAASAKPTSAAAGDEGSTFAALRSRPYLVSLGLLTAAAATWEAFIDYAMKARVAEAFPDRLALVSVFSAYYAAMNVLTFGVQAGVCAWALRKLGLSWTVAVLPAFVLVLAGGSAVYSSLVTIVLLRGGEGVLSSSLYRAGRELYFTPLSKSTKRATKTVLDVAATRVGDGVGTLGVLLIVAVAGDRAPMLALAFAGLTAALALTLMPGLDRGYVKTLARALERGLVRLSSAANLDATTRRTLANTTKGMSRAHLLAEIARLKRRGAVLDDGPPRLELGPSRALREQAKLLVSGNPAALSKMPASLELGAVGLTLPWLLEPEVAGDVALRLEKMAARATGTLTDMLLDSDQPMALRALIPRLLERAGTTRARDGIAGGLLDRSREVRVACAKSLAKLVRTHPTLKPEDAIVLAWAERDVTSEAASGSRDLESLLVAFTLLSMIVDRHALALAQQGLARPEAALRGTALEYLENVIDQPARGAIVAFLTKRALEGAAADAGKGRGTPLAADAADERR
jgi:ATP:ADP antiporter, AAA family